MTIDYPILALDPGQTTGWSLWTPAHEIPDAGQGNFVDATTLLGDKIVNYPGVQIVAERFVIGPGTVKKSQAPWSLEVIGCARWASLSTGRELVLQQAASAERLMTDMKLKSLGWYRPGQGHANDSLRHLGLYLMSRGWIDPRLLPQDDEETG